MLVGLENKCQTCSSAAFEQRFFSVVFSFCKFYLVSRSSLASSVSAGHWSERCWPIFPLRAAWLPCCAQGRLLVPKQDKRLCALIASQPLWHQLRSPWVTAGEKWQQLQPVVLWRLSKCERSRDPRLSTAGTFPLLSKLRENTSVKLNCCFLWSCLLLI